MRATTFLAVPLFLAMVVNAKKSSSGKKGGGSSGGEEEEDEDEQQSAVETSSTSTFSQAAQTSTRAASGAYATDIPVYVAGIVGVVAPALYYV